MKGKPARLGRGEGEVIGDAVRRDLGFHVLDRMWQRNDMTEKKSLRLAVEAQHATRPRRR